MLFLRIISVAVVLMVFIGCSDDAEKNTAKTAPASSPAVDNQQDKASASKSVPIAGSGGVSVQLIPENPTSEDCLRASIQGSPGRSAIIWLVNGQTVSSGQDAKLCPDSFKRGDLVSVSVGTTDKGAEASTTIANSPPRVVDISSTPDEIFAGVDISVVPVAEDADDDEVDFYYQWLINGEADPALTEATLPGSKFKKGDTIQVQITPNDFFTDGPVYASYEQPVPNAPPVITSQPPESITSLNYSYQVEVNDNDDNIFVFSLVEAPEGMSIDESTGLIEWMLADVPAGTYTIAILVSDPDGAEDAQEYTLTLGPAQ